MNIVLHVACVYALLLLSSSLGLEGTAARIGAVLFGIHPLLSETVRVM